MEVWGTNAAVFVARLQCHFQPRYCHHRHRRGGAHHLMRQVALPNRLSFGERPERLQMLV